MKITCTGLGRALGPLPSLPGDAAQAAPPEHVDLLIPVQVKFIASPEAPGRKAAVSPGRGVFLAQGAAKGKPWERNQSRTLKPHRGALAAADQGAPMGLDPPLLQQPRAWAFALRPGLRKTPLPGLNITLRSRPPRRNAARPARALLSVIAG